LAAATDLILAVMLAARPSIKTSAFAGYAAELILLLLLLVLLHIVF
jgi:hypothetical protein